MRLNPIVAHARTRTLALAALALGLLLVACGKERAADQWPISRNELSGQPAAPGTGGGEATYQRYCVGCHGADGRGNGGITGADFTAATSPLRVRSEVELASSVRDGKRGTTATMPAHSPILNDAQIAEVVGYVRSRFAGAATAN